MATDRSVAEATLPHMELRILGMREEDNTCWLFSLFPGLKFGIAEDSRLQAVVAKAKALRVFLERIPITILFVKLHEKEGPHPFLRLFKDPYFGLRLLEMEYLGNSYMAVPHVIAFACLKKETLPFFWT